MSSSEVRNYESTTFFRETEFLFTLIYCECKQQHS
jgi:hypothetical protein